MSCGDNTTLISKNITVKGRRTSVRLEPEMWNALKDIAMREKCTIHDICTLIKIRKNELTSLTAAIRVFLMLYYKSSSTDQGHAKAHHGNFAFMIKRAKISNDIYDNFSSKVKSELEKTSLNDNRVKNKNTFNNYRVKYSEQPNYNHSNVASGFAAS